MYQEGGVPGSAIGSRPVPRRRRKEGFFTPTVLLLLTAVLLTLIGVLLIMSSAVGFFSEDYPPPGIINITPSPTIAVVITNNAIPCSSVGKICDANDPLAVFQPVYTETVLGNATILYFNDITYPYYSVYGNTTLKAMNIYPVTVLVIEYLVPDVTVKKVIVDKRIITNGVLTDTTYKTVYVTYPDPDARFEIKIYDESGSLVAAEGFGGQYDTGMKDVITFFKQGNYTIEMTGKRIEFEVSIIEK
jgi:hypothetical protein